MNDYGDIGESVLEILGFGGVGIVLLIAGYVVVDLLTPGKLSDLVFVDRNLNASLITAAGVLAMAIVVAASIFSAEGDVEIALTSALAFGAAGLAIMAVSFAIIDALTPGKLGETVTGQQFHPASIVTACAHVSVGLIVAAAVS